MAETGRNYETGALFRSRTRVSGIQVLQPRHAESQACELKSRELNSQWCCWQFRTRTGNPMWAAGIPALPSMPITGLYLSRRKRRHVGKITKVYFRCTIQVLSQCTCINIFSCQTLAWWQTQAAKTQRKSRSSIAEAQTCTGLLKIHVKAIVLTVVYRRNRESAQLH